MNLIRYNLSPNWAILDSSWGQIFPQNMTKYLAAFGAISKSATALPTVPQPLLNIRQVTKDCLVTFGHS